MTDLVTFDCYGTLVDWEAGILEAFRTTIPESAAVADDELLEAFHGAQNALKTSEYRRYRQLLAETASYVADGFGWRVPQGDEDFVARSLPDWRVFPDVIPALRRLAESGCRLGILSNIDNDLLAGTLLHLAVSIDLRVTAENLQSYKPAPAHFEQAVEAVQGDRRRLVHVAQSLFHDVRTAVDLGIRVVWVNRKREPCPADLTPTVEVENVESAVAWLLGQATES
jgi:2-haloalkanoic acid dehalogenase type II